MRMFRGSHLIAVAYGGNLGQHDGCSSGFDASASAKGLGVRVGPLFYEARAAIMKKAIIALLFVMNMSSTTYGSNQNIKEPNVAGQFYSADPAELSRNIESYFQLSVVVPSKKNIPLLIVPHAGHVFSGAVAANSFKAASLGKYKTIVVIAPSHFVGFEGVSIWDTGGFKTPLGTIDVDQEFSQKLIASNQRFLFEPKAFAREHALEVELPFLQKTFKDFKLVPIVMGTPNLEDCRNLASSLNQIIGDREDVLIVISTDMSHYHPDAIARSMDEQTLAAIKGLKVEFLWNQIILGKMELCGFQPVTTALFYARERGLSEVNVLKYANSGDVTGEKGSVVGYSSIIFNKGQGSSDQNPQAKTSTFTLEQKKRLLQIARESITAIVTTGKVAEAKETNPRLSMVEGAFVTIHKNHQLRGCIGRIIGNQPLYLTVRDMAAAAATQDARFQPVSQEELSAIELEISVLSKPRRITDVNEIEMGVHGVIVSRDILHSGIFLPQVATETGWSREEFLSQLCSQKAGLPPDCWKDPGTFIEIYTAEVFSEKELSE